MHTDFCPAGLMLARAARAAVCYDDHDRGEAFVVSQCGHVLCRDAARSVALAAIQCAPRLGGGHAPCRSLHVPHMPVLMLQVLPAQ